MPEEIDDILQSLSDYKSDNRHDTVAENLTVKTFFYKLSSADNLVNATKKEFLEDKFIDELFEARDRFLADGYGIEIELIAKFKITPPPI